MSTDEQRRRFITELAAAKAAAKQLLLGLDGWRARYVSPGSRADLDLQALSVGLLDLEAKILELNIAAVDFVGEPVADPATHRNNLNLH